MVLINNILPETKMECIARFTPVSPSFFASRISLCRSFPGGVSIEPLRSSHDIHLIKPQIRERQRKEWWRWAELSDEDRDPTREDENEENLSSDNEDEEILSSDTEEEEEENISFDDEEEEENMSYEHDEDLGEELEEMEEEAMSGQDEGREPSDYDRRAHIFDESSRVFTALKEMHDNGSGGEDG